MRLRSPGVKARAETPMSHFKPSFHSALLLGGVILALAAAVAVPLLTTNRSEAPTAVSRLVETRLASIPVEGMVCLSCAAAIKQKVKSIDGVEGAEVQFGEKVVVVNYRADRPDVPAKAIARINSLGYKARPPVSL